MRERERRFVSADSNGRVPSRLNFRVQKNTRTQKGSDFAEVAYYVLKNRCNEDVTMSIWEINKILDEIAVENGKGKEGQKVGVEFAVRQ